MNDRLKGQLSKSIYFYFFVLYERDINKFIKLKKIKVSNGNVRKIDGLKVLTSEEATQREEEGRRFRALVKKIGYTQEDWRWIRRAPTLPLRQEKKRQTQGLARYIFRIVVQMQAGNEGVVASYFKEMSFYPTYFQMFFS